MDNQTRPTHQVIADRLGVTVATVSRLRSGERLPSVAIMARIKDLIVWSIDQQVTAKFNGSYHIELEDRLGSWWDRQTDSEPARA